MRLRTLAWVSVSVALLAGCSSGSGIDGLHSTLTSPTTPTVTRPAATAGIGLTVFLRADATAEEKQAIAKYLTAQPGVRGIVFESRADAFNRAKKVFANDPDLLKYLRPEAMKASFQVTADDTKAAVRVVAAARGLAGVDSASVAPPPQAPSPQAPSRQGPSRRAPSAQASAPTTTG